MAPASFAAFSNNSNASEPFAISSTVIPIVAATCDMDDSNPIPTLTATPPTPTSAVLTAPTAAVTAPNPLLATEPNLPILLSIPLESKSVSITTVPSAILSPP